jgi:hypothetical protein
MIKGTTPTLHYNLPFGTEVIKSAEIVVDYVDKNKGFQIVKTLDDCVIGENCLTTALTQEETLRLPAPSTVEIQLRILTVDELVFATEIQKVSVKRLLKEDVIE